MIQTSHSGLRLTVAPLLALLLVAWTILGAAGTDGTGPGTEQGTVRRVNGKRVLAISVDGLNPRALTRLGVTRAPHLHRLFRHGAGTYNARTQVERTVTLPNHTSMVTSRRITAARNGHGVTWNDDRSGTTVHGAAGEHVVSVFEVVHNGGGQTALFSTKAKFSLFRRSWPHSVDRSTIRVEDDAAVVRAARRDLLRNDRSFTFLHLGLADQVGHAAGWMSPRYLDAVARLDQLVGVLLRTIRRHELDDVVIVLTSDHGGVPGSRNHEDADRLANYRVPFVIWGPGVAARNLYRLNPTYQNPGRRRIGFSGVQPVRNGDLGNLATDLLGLGPIPDSRWDRRHRLSWN